MEIKFNGKRALVTGAGKGIGRAIAIALNKCGAKVVALSRSQEDLDSLKVEYPSIEVCKADISFWNSTRSVIEGLGHFDLLVNNAGILRSVSLLETTEDDIDAIFATNVKGLFNVSQVVVKSMLAKKSGGAIVNISSVAAVMGVQDLSVYCASKAAVDSLTSTMAVELGPYSIRTNSVNPTITMTKMGIEAWSDPARADPMKKRIPMGRFAEVSEVVDAVLYVLSDKASFLNGSVIPVEGGMLSS